MPDQNNTENQPLDTEDWEIAFEPYDGFPGQALTLEFNFVVLKSYLTIEPFKIREAIEGLDRAMEVLFKYTQFHEVAYGLFRKLVQGELSLAEEETLKALGLKF